MPAPRKSGYVMLNGIKHLAFLPAETLAFGVTKQSQRSPFLPTPDGHLRSSQRAISPSKNSMRALLGTGVRPTFSPNSITTSSCS